jgi:hypothetical protein
MRLLTIAAIALSVSALSLTPAKAAVLTAADWNTPSNGTIGGISFNVSGLSFALSEAGPTPQPGGAINVEIFPSAMVLWVSKRSCSDNQPPWSLSMRRRCHWPHSNN